MDIQDPFKYSLTMDQREELSLLSQFLLPQDMHHWNENIFGKYIINGFLVEANSEQKIQALSLSAIKNILKENGQKISGKKDVLINRILTILPDKIESIASNMPKLFICSKEVENRILIFRAAVKDREDVTRKMVYAKLLEDRIQEAFDYYKYFQMELPELWRKEPGELDKVKNILGISFVSEMSNEELSISKASAATDIIFGHSVKGPKNFLEKWKFLEQLKSYEISENEYFIERLNSSKKLNINENSVSSNDVIWSILNKQVLYIKDPYQLSRKYYQMAGIMEIEGQNSFEIRKLYFEFYLKSLLESEPYKLGLFKEIEICTNQECCPSCRQLLGKKYSIRIALSLMPLPNKDCVHISEKLYKLCDCYYENVIDD